MPIELPSTAKAEVERPQQSNPLLWLVELMLQPGTISTPPVLTRLCNYHQELQWPLGDPDTTTWYPFPFTQTPIEQNQEGDLSIIDLSVDNSSRMLMRWLHAGNGLEGNIAKLFLVPSSSLGLSYPNHQALPKEGIELRVLSCSATNEAVGFRLGDPNWFQVSSPFARYIGPRCRHDFAGPDGACGYVLNQFAAFTNCQKHIVACNERAGDMSARGLPGILPGNFGGHPGISRIRA